MARLRKGGAGDIDAVRSAIRPRLSRLQAGGVPATTLKPHTHSADQITLEPYGHIEAINVQAGIEELDDEKLARDGSQTMLGDLPMNHFSIDDVDDIDIEGTATVAEDVVMTGAVGLAQVTGVRRIDMAGDDDDSEGLIQYLERIIFNDSPGVIENPQVIYFNIADPDYSPTEGLVGWSGGDNTPVTEGEGNLAGFAASGSGVVEVILGWDVLYCVCGEDSVAKGKVVVGRFSETPLSVEQDSGHPVVDLYDTQSEIPALTNKSCLVGVAMSDAEPGEPLQVMRRGMLRDVTFTGDGPILWAGDDGEVTGTRPTAPSTLIRIGTPTDGASSIAVDVQVIPPISELSGVLVEAPQERDQFIFDAPNGRWEGRRPFPARNDSGATVAVGQKDYRIDATGAAPTDVELPAAADSFGLAVIVRNMTIPVSLVTILPSGGDLIDDEPAYYLGSYREFVELHCTDGTSWAVLSRTSYTRRWSWLTGD